MQMVLKIINRNFASHRLFSVAGIFLHLTHEHTFDIIANIEQLFYMYKIIHCIGSTRIAKLI